MCLHALENVTLIPQKVKEIMIAFTTTKPCSIYCSVLQRYTGVYYIVVNYHIVCLLFQVSKILYGCAGAGLMVGLGIGLYRYFNR